MKKKNKGTPEIPIKRIVLNPEQPRKVFDEQAIAELADTIQEYGVIEPIVVEECGDDYILHDGERRLRAARLVGLRTIPAVINPPLNGTGPQERLERALVANVQRAEMHIIEEGLAYQRLITEFKYSIMSVAQRVGKSYTWVHYAVSLVTHLEPEIQQLMLERQLPSADHKILKAFLSVPAGKERIALARMLAEHKATARMVVMACKNYREGKDALKHKRTRGSPVVKMVQDHPDEFPEWDALYQLGKVPPWPVMTESIMKTCDACPSRKIASDAVCRQCGLVVAMKNMMEVVNGH